MALFLSRYFRVRQRCDAWLRLSASRVMGRPPPPIIGFACMPRYANAMLLPGARGIRPFTATILPPHPPPPLNIRHHTPPPPTSSLSCPNIHHAPFLLLRHCHCQKPRLEILSNHVLLMVCVELGSVRSILHQIRCKIITPIHIFTPIIQLWRILRNIFYFEMMLILQNMLAEGQMTTLIALRLLVTRYEAAARMLCERVRHRGL